jgi:hypothetical protein
MLSHSVDIGGIFGGFVLGDYTTDCNHFAKAWMVFSRG